MEKAREESFASPESGAAPAVLSGSGAASSALRRAIMSSGNVISFLTWSEGEQTETAGFVRNVEPRRSPSEQAENLEGFMSER